MRGRLIDGNSKGPGCCREIIPESNWPFFRFGLPVVLDVLLDKTAVLQRDSVSRLGLLRSIFTLWLHRVVWQWRPENRPGHLRADSLSGPGRCQQKNRRSRARYSAAVPAEEDGWQL